MQGEKTYRVIKRLLQKKGWKENVNGEWYDNGTIITNFWKGNNIIQFSIDLYADEELLEALKG